MKTNTETKTETKHTPGPWNKDYTIGGQCIVMGTSPYTAKPHSRKVATVSDHSKSVGGMDETDANARLIAAAPSLLEALQDIVRAHDVKMGKSAVKLRIEIARDAIAKAEVQP